MKAYLFFLSLILIFCIIPSAALAVSPTPTTDAKPTISSSQKNESLVQQINELKDKIASRVAQLKLVEKKGIVGVVTEVNNTRITLVDSNNDIQLVDVDDITKFSSPSAKGTFGISDVQKGTTLSVLGLYNKQSKHTLARFVTTFVLPVFVSGKITDTNREDFTITVATKDNTTRIIDIETTTRINSYSQGKITRSGFSKLTTGDRVEIVGYANKEDIKRVSASYILQLDLTPSDTSTTP